MLAWLKSAPTKYRLFKRMWDVEVCKVSKNNLHENGRYSGGGGVYTFVITMYLNLDKEVDLHLTVIASMM